MSVVNGKITAPISIQDPYTCMGVAKTGDFYDVGYICSNAHGKINPYAKFKPVVWDRPDVDLHTGTNWKGEDGLCGFNVPVYASIGELTTGMLVGNTFAYKAPVPGKDWCRLLDFNGYSHYAPVGFFTSPGLQGETQLGVDGTVYFEVHAASSADASGDHVNFVDLSPINPINGSHVDASRMYVGVLFYRSQSEQFTVVSDKKYGEMSDVIGFSVKIDSSSLNKTWTYYVFLCEDSGLSPDTVFLPTDIKPTKVTFIAYGTGVEAYLSIRDIENENGLFRIAYENKGGVAVSYAGATATLYDSAGNELAFESIQNAFTLKANESKTVDFSLFYDFDGAQDPDKESKYLLSVKVTASSGSGYLYEEVRFSRYPDGTWKQL